jgi:hypothetical protein
MQLKIYGNYFFIPKHLAILVSYHTAAGHEPTSTGQQHGAIHAIAGHQTSAQGKECHGRWPTTCGQRSRWPSLGWESPLSIIK